MCICLTASVSSAQWTFTNAWDLQRGGVPIATNVFEAIRERLLTTVYQYSMAMVTNFYRDQHGMLEGAKIDIKRIMDNSQPFGIYSYFNTNGVSSLNGNTNFFFYNALNSWYSFEILPYLKMPTNYFTYTPYRMLNGWGCFNDNTNFTRPYGYTNATTAAGGANLPAGQPYWTTTDYGWQGCKDILNELVWFYSWSDSIKYKSPDDNSNNYWGNSLHTNYWADAQADALSKFGPKSISGTADKPRMYSEGKYIVPDKVQASLVTRTTKQYNRWYAGWMGMNGLSNFTYTIDFYNYGYAPSIWEFDANGQPVLKNAWTNYDSVSFDHDVDLTNEASVNIGTNTAPAWVTVSPSSNNTFVLRGFEAKGASITRMDASTNGFKYVK